MKKKTIKILTVLIVVCVLLSMMMIFAYMADDKMIAPGDVSGNGIVSTGDARIIMRVAMGLKTIEEDKLVYADVDDDGRITAADARLTLRNSVSSAVTEKHDFRKTGTVAPTCTKEGSISYLCSSCKIKKDIILDNSEHDYKYSSSVKATCEKKGEKIYKCTLCGDTYSEYTEKGDHKYTKPKIDAPSKCSVCGKKNKKSKMTETEIVKDLAGRVKQSEITKNMKAISDKIGSRWYSGSNVNKAYNKLISILKSYGYSSSDITTDYFTARNGVSQKNIYCRIPASKSGADVVMFSAHYDSADVGRGAVDNASGVCAVLEIARVLKSLNVKFDKEIRICFFSGEEVGYYGGYKYCSYFYNSLSRQVFTMNVDMAGHPKADKNWYLCLSTEPVGPTYSYRKAYSNNTSRTIDKAKKIIGSCGEYAYKSPVTAGAHDLLPFRRYGVAGVTLSWRERNTSTGSGNDYSLASPSNIHTYADTVANISLTSIYKTTRLMAGAAAEILFVK